MFKGKLPPESPTAKHLMQFESKFIRTKSKLTFSANHTISGSLRNRTLELAVLQYCPLVEWPKCLWDAKDWPNLAERSNRSLRILAFSQFECSDWCQTIDDLEAVYLVCGDASPLTSE